MKNWLIVAAVAVILAACGHEDSPTIKEALSIHEECMTISESLEGEINVEIDRLKTLLADSLNVENPGETMRLHNTLQALVASQEELSQWKSTVVEIPGHHYHEPGEVCEHDHSKDEILKNLPEEEILKMQQEMMSNLEDIKARTPISE